MSDISLLPDSISFFPGFTDRVYFQNPETKEFWFHATDVCRTLGFKNVTTALALHCDEDEKVQEIWHGKATWFVSYSGCIGLALAAKTDDAKRFKRWLKHDLIPKLTAEGGYIMPNATQPQIEGLQQQLEGMEQKLAISEGRAKAFEKKSDLYVGLSGITVKDFYGKLKVGLGTKFKAKVDHFCNVTVDYLGDMNLEKWKEDLGGNKLSGDYYYPLDKMILAARQYLINFERKALRAFDEQYGYVFDDLEEAWELATQMPISLSQRKSTLPPLA